MSHWQIRRSSWAKTSATPESRTLQGSSLGVDSVFSLALNRKDGPTAETTEQNFKQRNKREVFLP